MPYELYYEREQLERDCFEAELEPGALAGLELSAASVSGSPQPLR